MEEVEPSHESTVVSPKRPLHRWAMFAGFLLAFSEMMLRLLSGKDIVDAVWPHAVRSLDWTMALRSSPILTLSIFVLAGLGGYGLRKAVASAEQPPSWLVIPYGGLGLLLGLLTLHFLLDVLSLIHI